MKAHIAQKLMAMRIPDTGIPFQRVSDERWSVMPGATFFTGIMAMEQAAPWVQWKWRAENDHGARWEDAVEGEGK